MGVSQISVLALMSTHARASAVIPVNADTVWAALRDFTFPGKLFPSLVESCTMVDGKSPQEVGASRVVTWKSGAKKTQQLLELSDVTRRIVWETTISEPAAETAAHMTTVTVHRITDVGHALVTWESDFSSDVSAELISFEQKSYAANLEDLKKTLSGK